MYKYESLLVEDFQSTLRVPENPFSISDLGFEFNYGNGRTDIIGRTPSGTLFAFEAKLIRWRNALNQAYRNSSFANYSYVVLPKLNAKNAKRMAHEFTRRGIGLCSVDHSRMNIEIPAPEQEPLQPWLKEKALQHIGNS